jgi:early secretory antigenic target protein ESAT-6
MAGDYVLANFGTLADGESQFMAAYTGLTSTVNDLDAQLRGHLQDWQGSAQQAYLEAKLIWDKAIADMGLVIQGLSQVLGTANQNYQQAETTNAGMFA